MDTFKNNLPMAVHQVGGGEARNRTGGLVIPLLGVVSGSFSTGTASKIRVCPNLRTSMDAIVLLSFDVPTTMANAEYSIGDRETLIESLSESFTIYFRVVDIAVATDRNGGPHDYLCVTFYE